MACLTASAGPSLAQNDTSPTAPTPGTTNRPVNPPPVAGEKTPPGIVTPNTKLPSPSNAAPSAQPPQASPGTAAPNPSAKGTATPSVTGPSITAPVPALKPDATPPGGGAVPRTPGDKPKASPETSNPSGSASTAKMVTLEPREVAMLSGEGKWDDGFTTIMGAMQKVQDALAKADIKAAGHPMAAFRETDENGFKFDVMVPVAAGTDRKTTLPGGITLADSPAGKALKFEHRDSYDAIDSTYEAITAYLDEKGFDSKNLFVEEYLNAAKAPDDTGMQTDIFIFVK